MAQCTWVSEQKRLQLSAEEEREVTTMYFSVYGHPLEMVTSFKYLGRVISSTENDWMKIVRNLARAKTVWSRMSRILSRMGAPPWVSGLLFKAVIQAVLLFGAETWVVTPIMGKALVGRSDPVGETADRKYPAEDNGRYMEIHLVFGRN